jgi:hypothetical protein
MLEQGGPYCSDWRPDKEKSEHRDTYQGAWVMTQEEAELVHL